MSVYKKMAMARVMLQSIEMTKSGHNKFANYRYFELADIMPHINVIFDQLGLFGWVTYDKEKATLTIRDVDGDDAGIHITSPMAEASMKGCHPIQSLGAVETYQRRYLWMTALEIVEHDALDASEPMKEEKPVKKEHSVKKEQENIDNQLIDFQSQIESAISIDNLLQIWQTIPRIHHKALEQAKNKTKARLTKSTGEE
jgi:hypothetical protein